MPRYYFDIHDKDGEVRDAEGLILGSMEEAVLEARRTLIEMVRDSFKDPETNGICIRIRDGVEGPMLVSVTLESGPDHDQNDLDQHM